MESRVHERFRVWLPIQVASDAVGPALGVSKDASQGGLLMAATEPLPVDSVVRLTFTLPDETERTVSAKIIRMERNADDPHGPWPFRVAVKFLEPLGDLDDLLRAVEQQLTMSR